MDHPAVLLGGPAERVAQQPRVQHERDVQRQRRGRVGQRVPVHGGGAGLGVIDVVAVDHGVAGLVAPQPVQVLLDPLRQSPGEDRRAFQQLGVLRAGVPADQVLDQRGGLLALGFGQGQVHAWLLRVFAPTASWQGPAAVGKGSCGALPVAPSGSRAAAVKVVLGLNEIDGSGE